MTSEPEALET